MSYKKILIINIMWVYKKIAEIFFSYKIGAITSKIWLNPSSKVKRKWFFGI